MAIFSSDHMVLVGNPNALGFRVVLMPGVHELAALVHICEGHVRFSLRQILLVSEPLRVVFVKTVPRPINWLIVLVFVCELLHDSHSVDLRVHFEDVVRFLVGVVEAAVGL